MRAHAVVGLEGETARIVDLVLPPDRTIAVSFLAQLTARLAQRGAARVETWVPEGHFVASMLSSAGYVREPEPLGIVPTARSFDPELTIGWTSDNLYYTMADSDLV
jgi:hypothetical protein